MLLHISNIGNHVTTESLRAVFATYGKVDKIDFVKNSSGNSFHTAHIEMSDEKDAIKAISRLHGSIINGCGLSVTMV
jgi:RNA recognition motif-containing protein